MKVFVYGSLRRYGQLNYYLDSSEFLGEHLTKPEYTLYSLGAFPALVEIGTTSVLGEVYEISLDIRNLLDRVEGHPNMYVRTPIELLSKMEVETYLFHYVPYGCDVVISGDWHDYLTS